jgi:hypothetical protein
MDNTHPAASWSEIGLWKVGYANTIWIHQNGYDLDFSDEFFDYRGFESEDEQLRYIQGSTQALKDLRNGSTLKYIWNDAP